jgi:hypothetical protein
MRPAIQAAQHFQQISGQARVCLVFDYGHKGPQICFAAVSARLLVRQLSSALRS